MRPVRKRRYERTPSLVLLNIEVLSTHKMGRAAIINISPGGAGFVSEVNCPNGEEVMMRFTFRSGKFYLLEGIISRVRDLGGRFEYGVKFRKMGFFDRLKLLKLISIVKK